MQRTALELGFALMLVFGVCCGRPQRAAHSADHVQAPVEGPPAPSSAPANAAPEPDTAQTSPAIVAPDSSAPPPSAAAEAALPPSAAGATQSSVEGRGAPPKHARVRVIHRQPEQDGCLEMYGSCTRPPDRVCTSQALSLGCGESARVPSGREWVRCACP